MNKNRDEAVTSTQGNSNPEKRANDLNGSDWTRFSMSVWNDVKRTPEERALKHPAMFPIKLVERLLRCYTRDFETEILDPFMGSGSTLVAAHGLGKHGIGVDLYKDFIKLAKSRFDQTNLLNMDTPEPTFIHGDARDLLDHLSPESIDMCITSPPYWDILKQKRTADSKEIRNYGDDDSDLGTTHDYTLFLEELAEVFKVVFSTLKAGKYLAVNVMDLRKQSTFYPLHIDMVPYLKKVGFELDDIFIWDRRADYNNLRSLGYPYVFRLNKIHEYLMIFQKPRA